MRILKYDKYTYTNYKCFMLTINPSILSVSMVLK